MYRIVIAHTLIKLLSIDFDIFKENASLKLIDKYVRLWKNLQLIYETDNHYSLLVCEVDQPLSS